MWLRMIKILEVKNGEKTIDKSKVDISNVSEIIDEVTDLVDIVPKKDRLKAIAILSVVSIVIVGTICFVVVR